MPYQHDDIKLAGPSSSRHVSLVTATSNKQGTTNAENEVAINLARYCAECSARLSSQPDFLYTRQQRAKAAWPNQTWYRIWRWTLFIGLVLGFVGAIIWAASSHKVYGIFIPNNDFVATLGMFFCFAAVYSCTTEFVGSTARYAGLGAWSVLATLMATTGLCVMAAGFGHAVSRT